MSNPQVYEGPYLGESAIWLKAGPYEAAILPSIGANLIAFRHVDKGYALLHEPKPEEMESFKARPIIHGIPILFPPNRYEDGKFPWEGKTYEFPINEENRGNHLHGFLHNIPWQVESKGTVGGESSVTLVQHVAEGHPVYTYLPHSFTVKLKYTLSEDGLQQQVSVRNNGQDKMPCLLAFHTAVNAPFVPGGEAKDYRVRLTIGERWEMTERMLPTGQYQPLSEAEVSLKTTGVYPFFDEMDNHYTAVPVQGRNRMELSDTKHQVTLVYDAGTAYKQWMIWNNFATEGFFCPEPQMNLVNAPNVKGKSADEIGLIGLEPGEVWGETSRLYIIERSLA